MAGGTEEFHELRNKTLELIIDHDILNEGMFYALLQLQEHFTTHKSPPLESTIPKLP